MLAQEITLTLPEILGHILVLLPMQSLLTTALLVSKHWYDTINNSPAIQQKLFFHPTPKNDVKFGLNPFFENVFSVLYTRNCMRKVFLEYSYKSRIEAVIRKDASWRRMQVQQPLLLTAVRQHRNIASGYYVLRCSIEDPRGLLTDHFWLSMEENNFDIKAFYQILWYQFPFDLELIRSWTSWWNWLDERKGGYSDSIQ